MDRVFRTAEQFAYIHLRERILSGELKGGTRINPTEIAAELGVSRMPVREALRLLDSEGLITIQLNRRAVVTSLTIAEIEELFEIRAVLEGLAVRLAVPRFTTEHVRELEVLHSLMNEAQHDLKKWIQRHSDFHDYIVQVAGGRHLRSQLNRIRSAVQVYLLMYASVYSGTDQARYEHDAIIEAVRSGNPRTAEECMLDHVRTTARGLVDYLRSRSDDAVKAN